MRFYSTRSTTMALTVTCGSYSVNMYREMSIRIKWDDLVSDKYLSTKEFSKEQNYRLPLYKCYNNAILDSVTESGLGCHMGTIGIATPTCADDILVLANSECELQGIMDIFEHAIEMSKDITQNERNKWSFNETGIADTLFNLLNDLDAAIRKKAPERKIYGNIYSGKGRMQILSYISAVKEFSKKHPIRTVCEIGFAGGHSATLFLLSTTSANYTGFDMWDQSVYENTAIDWVRKQFNRRHITLIKGDSTKTVPQFKGTCDLIHIDGAHHAHFPQTDMKNMARVASENNLLLMDDCSKSWPAVLKGVDYLKKNDFYMTLKCRSQKAGFTEVLKKVGA
ncbi:unnamed protein product [Mytilus coruscus]|uniref:Uncharacterized protein n=1 Tax=Mytilus coruscus TaxID=42192 RepID=A0A6J8EI17_MYTCO|nr:unnamed protein product [Mytilus coruscus]